ncbi:MAG TPA: hypothetical protein VNL17_14440 [Verrucomicrobiae bacterium]|nr:hypothetical protein [Verrucomicrobiae bacterium]
MPRQVDPEPQLEFHGVYTAGNPIRRPAHTAAKCLDFRVMPGYYLRLRGGRKARYNIPSATSVLRIVPYRDPHFFGWSYHPMQVNLSGTVKWVPFQIATYQPDPFNIIEVITGTYDGNFSLTNPAAACILADRPLLYNGLGVLSGSGSQPAFSTYYSSVTRYYGLDAYAPGGVAPSVAFAAGAGNNTVATSVDIYVGLYSSQTGHYSNGVKCGTITTTGATGTITVSNLARIVPSYHNATEQSELFYVFYATVDGGTVPYLILNSGLTGPFTVAISSGSASLSIASGTTNGWVLDLTKEMPFQNYPPRPMQSVCYVNGRVYGCLLAGGSGTRSDFSYVPATKDLAAVVWSQAASDSARQNVVGDPNQCWPLTNIAYTPSADAPIAVIPAQDNVRVLVLTPSSCFLLQEVADGIHEYITISRNFGCKSAASVISTPYGICWVTQHNEIVMLPPYSIQLQYLSRGYQSLITGNVKCADWIFDPVEQIDRYQIWMDNGVSVIHDFALGDGQSPGSGEAYSATQPVFTCAATVLDGNGTRYFLVCTGGVYTHETQPDTGVIPTTDQTFTTGQSFTTADINGEYDRNWGNFGDTTRRKELPFMSLTGDAGASTQLGVSPVAVEWYGDFQQVTGANKQTTTIQKGSQSTTDQNYLVKFAGFNKLWFKLVFKLSGHSSDDASFANFITPSQQGDLAKNFYGAIHEASFTLSDTVNRV